MAENLDYNVSGSKCYNDDPANCTKYGRLYDWTTAMNLSECNSKSCSSQIGTKHQGVCPSGWHIPSNADWNVLITAVGDASTASKYLKATNGWAVNGNGEDKYGFSALPNGFCYSNGQCSAVGTNGNWWSATESNASKAYYKNMVYSNEGMSNGYNNKDYLFSVRCLQD